MLDSLISEYGTHDPIRLRELAGLRIVYEQTQVLALNGDTKAREDIIRISNTIDRRERELRLRSKPAARPGRPANRLAGYLGETPQPQSLADRLKDKYPTSGEAGP